MSGRPTKETVVALIHTLMAARTMASGKTTRSMGMERECGPMVKVTLASGATTRGMVKGRIPKAMGRHGKANGRTMRDIRSASYFEIASLGLDIDI